MDNSLEWYFDDSRLHMTLPGRLFVRVAGYVHYLVLAVLTAVFLMSDIPWMRWSGVFLLLFFVDRLLHAEDADRLLSELPQGGRVNLAKYLAPSAFRLIEHAFERSIVQKKDFFLTVAHELLERAPVREALTRLDVPLEGFRQKLESFLEAKTPIEGAAHRAAFRAAAESLVLAAGAVARNGRHRCIELADLFAALPAVKHENLARLFDTFGVQEGDVMKALLFAGAKRSFGNRRFFGVGAAERFRPYRAGEHKIMNRAWTSRPTPALDRVSVDLTDRARNGQIGFMVGHTAEYSRLLSVLSRPTNPNALLVGDEGVGKETIVAHLARNIVHDTVPVELFDKRLVLLEIGSLVAGITGTDVGARIQEIANEIVTAGNVILYIPDAHDLVKSGNDAFLSAADALLPILKSDTFPTVAATYPREFKTYIEPRSDFVGIFDVIRVEEMSEPETEELLVYTALMLEQTARVTISFGAIREAVKIAHKYFRHKFLPGSAEELLKETFVVAVHRGDTAIHADTVIELAESKVNVPLHDVETKEASALLRLEATLHERLVDQEEAVKAVSQALRQYRSGLTRKGGPIASFLFVGPTGVGKTELAKALARVQFGSEQFMLRFDMTEFQDKASFQRFIGTPDRAVAGLLTSAVLEKPYSLVLLDEFEKAYPDILNLFLQVLDDGRLTDGVGRTVDFTNTIVIATSNAHSDIIIDALRHGDGVEKISGYLKERLVDVFRPELLNRFSKIIVFKNLEIHDVRKIAAMNLQELAAQVLEQGITLTFDDAAVNALAKLGFDPAFGARPLRRAMDDHIRAPLSEKLLKKEVVRGGTVLLSADNDRLTFVVQET